MDFDPVKAKAERRQPTGLDSESAALFPDSFHDSTLGSIPEGWKTQPVYASGRFVNGNVFRQEHFSQDGTGLPIVKIAELKSGLTGQTKFTNEVFDERYLVDSGAIVFAWSGSPDTSIGTFLWTKGRGWLNQHVFSVTPTAPLSGVFLYYLLKYLTPVFIPDFPDGLIAMA